MEICRYTLGNMLRAAADQYEADAKKMTEASQPQSVSECFQIQATTAREFAERIEAGEVLTLLN